MTAVISLFGRHTYSLHALFPDGGMVMSSGKWLGVSLVKVASVYLVLALLLGLWMSIRKDFTLLPVHSHVALLGWAAMAITAPA